MRLGLGGKFDILTAGRVCIAVVGVLHMVWILEH